MSRSDGRPVLSPSGIGQYIAFSECPRYLKLRFDDQGEEAGREWNEAFKPLSVLLSGTGESFEDETREAIEQHATESIHAKEEWEFSYDLDEEFPQSLDASQAGFEQMLTEVATLEGDDGPLLLYEAPLCGRIGVWPIGGRADVVALWPAEDGTVRVHVLEIKASWKPKAYHQIQAGIYTLLLREIFHSLDVDYEISAGVIHREVNTADFARENLPSFDLEPREADVKRLLAVDAKIDRVLTKDLEDVRFQLNAKCNDCIFNESCFTRAVEGKKTALLGLTIGEQKALEQHGVETIEQVARLKEVPENPVPWEYHNLNPRDGQQELAEQLLNEPAIGGKLDEIIQRAQSMLGEVHPGHEDAREEPYAPSFVGAGRSTLPDDDPPNWDSIAYSAGELIQVYLHVEWDYMRDRLVMLSARINCDDFPASALKFSEITESLPDDPDESKEVEKDLLTTFFGKLFMGIQEVAEITGNPETAPIHLYLFSSLERDRLMDAIRRHPEFIGADMSERPHPVRDLLGLRAAIDQPMVSIIQDEIDDRFALKFPSTGLLPALEQFVDGDGVGWWNYPEWAVEKEDGTEINLRHVFYHNFFNNESPYALEDDGSIRLLLERGAYQSPEQEGFYPLRARFGNQIPLEYIWAAKDKLDTGWASEEQRQERRAIEKYKWHNRQEKTHRISEEELDLLGKKLCHAIEHIESGLIGKNAQLGKAPIEVPRLDTFTLGETNLARACREYLDLEYYSNRQEMLRHYATSPKQRVQTGRSAIIRVESTERTAEGLQVEGHLLYDELGFSSPQQVANSCRLKGSEGATSGSWMVATALERDDNSMFTETDHATPEDIEKSVPTKVEAIDTPDRSITLKFSNFFNENEGHGQYLDRAYEVRHNSWTEDPEEEGEYTEYVTEGGIYILDKQADDMTARRASHTLDEANRNHLTQILEGLLGDTPVSNELEFCDPDLVGTFIEWLQNAEGLDSPNTEQERFIRRANYQVSCLQGPPGTGKTGGGLASAILTRAYARMADGKHLRGIVTAPSNKAVYEILEDVAEIREAFVDSDDETLDDLRIVRATGKDTSDFDHLDGVEYLNYGQEEAKVEELAEALTRQRGLGDFMNGQQAPASVLLFVTPSGSYGLMNKVAKAWGEENARDILGRMQRYFNFLAVDEASMMPLSQFILCGAFINENAQILVAGDHRQMPPVQKHDWDREDRRTVEEIAPHLSALDFFRFLKGDLEVEHTDLETASDLPMARLELTYRCHKRVAEMLRRWLYEKYDEIEYQSDQTATLADPVTDTEGIQKILDPDHPLILILHNEDMSQQANPTEAAIANAVIDGIDDQDSFGIVTPHNAQRGLLKNEIGTDADIDTVERFQGGQRDLIIVSGTASDPESIRQKTDFILSPNRLNVAMSRMKKKLIVIASQSMFEVIPADAEDYEDALLWRGLYHEVGAGESTPVWEGSLADVIATENNEAQNISIEVYSGS